MGLIVLCSLVWYRVKLWRVGKLGTGEWEIGSRGDGNEKTRFRAQIA